MSLALVVGLLVAAVVCTIAIIGIVLDRWAARHAAAAPPAERTPDRR